MVTNFNKFQVLWLLISIIIGTGLRLSNLGDLPPWTDECATLVFSLGHSFKGVPLNQVISAETLLQPLQILPHSDVTGVFEHLFKESTHPPLYFVLTHWWLRFWGADQGLVSVVVARSLAVFLSVLSIPALFLVGLWLCRSLLVAQISAALIAIAPFNLFLGQQARHYSLIILLTIASLACLVTTLQKINAKQSLPLTLALCWITVNGLGFATHYFFGLVLFAQFIVFIKQIWQQRATISRNNYIWLFAVTIGTLAACLVWLPSFLSIYGSEPTAWVADGKPQVNWLEPPARMIMWFSSMLVLLPSAATNMKDSTVAIFGVITVILLLITLPPIRYGCQLQTETKQQHLTVQILSQYLLVITLLFFIITYGFGMDLTIAARFHFGQFPAFILLISVGLAGCWQHYQKISWQLWHWQWSGIGKLVVILVLLMGLGGSITELAHIGYLQNHRPDLLVPIIEKKSQAPILIATSHKHHGQTGRMMGIAWQWQKKAISKQPPQYFLADKDSQTDSYDQAITKLTQTIATLPRPFELWLVDFRTNFGIENYNCQTKRRNQGYAGEYRYKRYYCST